MKSLISCLVVGLALGALPAEAEPFPTRPVQIIVPTSPAGVTDIAARVVGERLSKIWGKQVVVENRPGGAGSVGVMAAARATPDGYTLLASTNAELALGPVINRQLKYDFNKDFTPLAMVTNTPLALVANTGTPYKTLAEVIDAAKKEPAHITWASPGIGTWNQLTGEWLFDALGIKLIHVPYRGGGPAGTAIAAGDVSLGVVAISSAMPHLQSGRMRIIAMTSDRHSNVDPSWPTISELAVPGFNSMQWVGFYAPPGLAPELRDKITGDVLKVLAEKDIIDRFQAMGVEVMGKDGNAALKQLSVDSGIAKEISAKANIHID